MDDYGREASSPSSNVIYTFLSAHGRGSPVSGSTALVGSGVGVGAGVKVGVGSSVGGTVYDAGSFAGTGADNSMYYLVFKTVKTAKGYRGA